VIIVGLLMILGGISAVCSPKEFTMLSPGYDPAVTHVDRVSKQRVVVTGYVSVIAGIATCCAGFFMKGRRFPDPHDTEA